MNVKLNLLVEVTYGQQKQKETEQQQQQQQTNQ